jgi:biopolymer transport protein TolQ
VEFTILPNAAHLPGLLQEGVPRGDVWSIVTSTGAFARGILVILLGFSVVSWAIMLERWFTFRRFREHARRFLQMSRRVRNPSEARALAERERTQPIGRLWLAGYRELSDLGMEPGSAPTADHLAILQRSLERGATAEVGLLEARLAFLATTGSVSPFIGLLGTVWGVMTAFMDMGVRGSANLAVVAPGIAEALVATAAGLAAAIPAVVGYNYFVGRARAAAIILDGQTLEFLNLVQRGHGR